MEATISTKVTIHYGEDLPQLEDLAPTVRQEVMDRVGYALASMAWLYPPLSPKANGPNAPSEYTPTEVHISIDRQVAVDPATGTHEDYEAGYLPVVEYGTVIPPNNQGWGSWQKKDTWQTDMWGIVVRYLDPDDGSSGSNIYRTQYGDLAHWM